MTIYKTTAWIIIEKIPFEIIGSSLIIDSNTLISYKRGQKQTKMVFWYIQNGFFLYMDGKWDKMWWAWSYQINDKFHMFTVLCESWNSSEHVDQTVGEEKKVSSN